MPDPSSPDNGTTGCDAMPALGGAPCWRLISLFIVLTIVAAIAYHPLGAGRRGPCGGLPPFSGPVHADRTILACRTATTFSMPEIFSSGRE